MAADPPLDLELEVGARVFMGWAEKAGGSNLGAYHWVLRVGRRWGTKDSSLDGG